MLVFLFERRIDMNTNRVLKGVIKIGDTEIGEYVFLKVGSEYILLEDALSVGEYLKGYYLKVMLICQNLIQFIMQSIII